MGSSKRKQDVVISAGDDRKKKIKTVKDSGKVKKDKKDKKDKEDADYSKKDSKKDYKKKKSKKEESDDEESEIEIAPKGAEVELTFDGSGPGYKPLEDSDEEMEGDEKEAGAKGTPGVALPGNENKSREAHAAQKKAAAERKAAKPNADILTRGKKVWEQIRRKDIKKDERKKLIAELCDLMRGKVKELVFKHDASRIVQTVVKYGDKNQREEIARELKGTYPDMAQSNYGRYLAEKIMHYGSAEIRSMVVKEFYGQVRKLIKHKAASIVLEDIYREYATAPQKATLLREFYGVEFAVLKNKNEEDTTTSLVTIFEKNPEKRPIIMKSLLELLKSIIEKDALFYTITHKAMLEYISNARPGTTETEEFLDAIKEQIHQIPYTKDGAHVAMYCFAHANAKDRKTLFKSLKPNIVDTALHKTGYVTLLTALDVTDDTKLSTKTLLSELQPRFIDLATHPLGRIALLYPIVGRSKRLLNDPSAIKLLQEMDEIRSKTSKKDTDLRQKETALAFLPVLLKELKKDIATLFSDPYGTLTIFEILLSPHLREATTEDEVNEVLQELADLAVSTVNSEEEETKLQPHSQRLLKGLSQGGHFDVKTKTILRVLNPPLGFSEVLYGKIKKDVMKWAGEQETSFVVVGMLEGGEWKGRDELLKTLKKGKKDLEKKVEEGVKGAGVILKML